MLYKWRYKKKKRLHKRIKKRRQKEEPTGIRDRVAGAPETIRVKISKR